MQVGHSIKRLDRSVGFNGDRSTARFPGSGHNTRRKPMKATKVKEALEQAQYMLDAQIKVGMIPDEGD